MMGVVLNSMLIFFLMTAAADASVLTVKKVVDGDTLELSDGKMVHLIGIDAPENIANEKAEIFARNSGRDVKDIIAKGKESEKFLKKLLEGKQVRLEFDTVREDKKGNLLAYVFVVSDPKGKKDPGSTEGVAFADNGDVFVNATMVKSGYASPQGIPPNVKYSQFFKQLSIEAINNKRGLWK